VSATRWVGWGEDHRTSYAEYVTTRREKYVVRTEDGTELPDDLIVADAPFGHLDQ